MPALGLCAIHALICIGSAGWLLRRCGDPWSVGKRCPRSPERVDPQGKQRDAADDLGLSERLAVTLLIKATEVSLAVE